METSYSGQSLSANKEPFNSQEASRKYDEQPLHAEMARRIGNALLKAYPFNEESTTVLDFACGTELSLLYTKSILGVDSNTMNAIRNQGIPEEEMHAVCVPEELVTDVGEAPTELEKLLGGLKFDVVICCMAYHHIRSIPSITCTLSSCLKPGGYLFVADVESVSRPSSSAGDLELGPLEPIFSDGVCDAGIVVHQYGFSEQSIKTVFYGGWFDRCFPIREV
ncbi:hypothetical protein BT96DRAFT_913578 [Gymnopus androsaceus JB14]|uniref:S-adenosyl-L-methionine-dependent methyltransferase n=1 Tax=Gymnopus androsaceus JB14 TaxID=1447944 RepID=A0A6A4IK04_9AGAR|nr:hypothetical protein BT96DRAFT_913578 [Gymnopus androsaceus JB14]